MSNSDNRTNRLFKILGLILLAAAGCLTLVNIMKSINDPTSLITQILCLFSLIFAASYIAGGYSKDNARFYKNFGIVLLASHAMIVPLCCLRDTTPIFIISLILLAVLFILVLSENLGKTVSLTLCAVLVLCEVISLFVTNDGIIPIFGMITKLVTYFMYGVFTYAKYVDKAARGSR